MRLLSLAVLLVFPGFAAETDAPAVHVHNFGMVNAHLLRGAQPSASDLAGLSSAGVKVIIDLREAGKATELEKREAEKLGIQYTNIPLPPLSAPPPDKVRIVLNLLAQNQSQKVFVHCRRGKDRTGTVIACYRIQHDGWNNARAFEEAQQYGMSPAERGMRAFIGRFTPASNQSDPLPGLRGPPLH